MASTYMRNYRQAAEAERDQKLAEERRQAENEIHQIRCKRKHGPVYSDGLWPVVGCCTVAGFLLPFAVTGLPSMAVIVAGFFAGFVVRYLFYSSANSAVNGHNQRLNEEEDQVARRSEAKCRQIEQDCQQKIAAEEARYKQGAARARQAFGGSTVLAPVVNWLMTAFSKQIQSADRGIYLSVIEAYLIFEVSETDIKIFVKNPHSGQLVSPEPPFNLKTNGIVHYQNLPDLLDRVGFAQALAKQLQFEVAKRYPSDPVAPMRGAVPKLALDYDDSRMTVTYQVRNPRYQAPVNPKKGVR